MSELADSRGGKDLLRPLRNRVNDFKMFSESNPDNTYWRDIYAILHQTLVECEREQATEEK